MRVTQQMLFSRYVTNMNRSLTDLMDLNLKAQTEKKVNKPSDDPTGTTRILGHRDTISSLEQFQENVDTAKGWLGASDETLRQTNEIIIRAKELATQAASGTLSDDNREQISYEVRSLFEQLVGLANTDFEDHNIYSGHKTSTNAYQQVTWLTTNDTDLAESVDFTISGLAEKTALVQFYDSSGATALGGNINLSDPNLRARYSIDGGDTWINDISATAVGTGYSFDFAQSGTSVRFHADATVKANDLTDTERSEGTWLWLRPSAQYMGDDNDDVSVDRLGAGSSTIAADASGHFASSNVVVRIDNTAAASMDEAISYSYSLDGGISWVTGNATMADTTSNAATLTIPGGGVISLSSNGGNELQPGQQFVIRSRASDISLVISASDKVRVNDEGKDIFGGIYMDPDKVLSAGGAIISLDSTNAILTFQSNATWSTSVEGSTGTTKNLFETMGNLVAFLETNNQTGVQQALANLGDVQKLVTSRMADVGGRLNRLEVAENILDGLKLNEQTLMSSIEDADVSQLMTDLVQSQIVYEAVLSSSASIMKLNLGNYI